MQKKESFFPFFLVFFGLSLLLIFIGTTGIFGDINSIFNRVASPGKSFANILTLKSLQNKTIKSLTTENLKLKKQMQNIKNITDENNALRNQFAASEETSQSLLPAKIIGSPGFIPGVTLPEYFIINKGKKAGVKIGDPVVVENYLVGKITSTFPDFSKIELVTNKNSSFTAKIVSESEIAGVIKGEGNGEMELGNVILSNDLKKDSVVLTKGDKDDHGNGYPPDLNIGKIISVDKKQSDLFQKASIKSPIDFKNLEIVFILQSRN